MNNIKNKVKIEYLPIIMAYLFVFLFMPAIHSHYPIIYNHHCSGHMHNQPEHDKECKFCPIVYATGVIIPSIYDYKESYDLLYKNLMPQPVNYQYNYLVYKHSRAPPFYI